MQVNIQKLLIFKGSSCWHFSFYDLLPIFLGEDFCACTHMLQVNLGDVVELVLIDEGYAYDVMHPFHLHGHSFYVVAMERHAEIPDHIGPAPGKYWLTYFMQVYLKNAVST